MSTLRQEVAELRGIMKNAKRLKRKRPKTDAERIAELEAEVRQLGIIADVCTYDTLKKVCFGCRCKRAGKERGTAP